LNGSIDVDSGRWANVDKTANLLSIQVLGKDFENLVTVLVDEGITLFSKVLGLLANTFQNLKEIVTIGIKLHTYKMVRGWGNITDFNYQHQFGFGLVDSTTRMN